MFIIIAPNAFKDCLPAKAVASAIEAGVKTADCQIDTLKIPIADGGDGFLDVLAEPLNATFMSVKVHGPRFQPVTANFLYSKDRQIASIEMAHASGLALLKTEERNAGATTSYGTGEIIKAAINLGAQHIYLGAGGSACNDGGMGIAAALGYKFLDKNQKELSPVGLSLIDIAAIDERQVDRKLSNVTIDVLCDVDSPLLGPTGAAYLYGPQKGATPELLRVLDQGLANFATLIKKKYGKDVSSLKGGGAAGGIGAGMAGLFNSTIHHGIDVVLELLNFRTKLQGAALVITGEGKIDNQTAQGKAPAGVAKIARECRVPCIALTGNVGDNLTHLHSAGIDAVFSICPRPLPLDLAITQAPQNIAHTAEQIVRLWKISTAAPAPAAVSCDRR